MPISTESDFEGVFIPTKMFHDHCNYDFNWVNENNCLPLNPEPNQVFELTIEITWRLKDNVIDWINQTCKKKVNLKHIPDGLWFEDHEEATVFKILWCK